ncbi:exodeoxyribonuclease V subunit gamma [Amphibiibacter pelophylacis]|uniref:Exodeoxyribonuclease V subunit gamma n=1 Tax=Amphibiibacter pelophylacis TaxID=1799477 RepID=A0ACC6NZ01_9BURK
MADTAPATGLMVIHANQTESLRDVLIAWMRRHPLAPLDTEHLLVQSQGMGQWLRLAMARPVDQGGLGVCAGVRTELPAQLVWRLYRTVLGAAGDGVAGQGGVPAQSPFDRQALLWRLMRLLPGLARQPVFAPLQRFLQGDADGRRCHQLAQRLADLLDQYQVYRADWLALWARGQDALLDGEGRPLPLPGDAAWQPALWRALCDDVGPDLAGSARSAVHQRFVETVEGWTGEPPSGLPTRLMVFGLSSLPQQTLEALALLSRWRPVLVGVQNPCAHHWLDAVPGTALQRRRAFGPTRQARRPGQTQAPDDDSLHLASHPLLAAWGQQGRDFMALLARHDEPGRYRRHFDGERVDLFLTPLDAGHPHRHGLLQQLQDDIFDLRPLHETRSHWPAPDPATAAQDASLRFVIAHSPQREVEILHDTLLAALARDATLQPQDILVMVPDIQRYAPHVRAVFGLPLPGDARRIAFHLADQGLGQIDPLPGVLARLLDIRQQRLPLAPVLDALELPALRRRFGLQEADLPLLRDWLDAARLRWGLHDAHRQSLGLPPAPDTHTWAFGLRRLLLGYAVGDSGAWQDIEPLDAAAGLQGPLLGALARLIDALDTLWRRLAQPLTPPQWGELLHGVLRDFFEPEGDQTATLDTLARTLDDWLDLCASAGLVQPLPLAVVSGHWLEQIGQQDSPRAFLGGGVTFATLMPMRAIPFRHIHLLGLNDGDFPRAKPAADFDLMALEHRPGDRSRREDDRYLFLEALLSARERLGLSWVGRSAVDGSEQPPSVLVAQLRDHIAAGWATTPEEGDKLLAALTTVHRLHPYDPDYASRPVDPQGSAAADDGLFSYAREWHASSDTAPPVPLGLAGRLPELERDTPLELSELARWLANPAKAFLGQRLGVHLDEADADPPETEPFALDGLELWGIKNDLLQAVKQAVMQHGGFPEPDPETDPDDDPDDDPEADLDAEPDTAPDSPLDTLLKEAAQRQVRRGELPPGAFGDIVQDGQFDLIRTLAQRWQVAHSAAPTRLPSVALDWPAEDGRPAVVGDLGEIYVCASPAPGGGETPTAVRRGVTASSLVKKGHWKVDKLMPEWVMHLAAQVAPALKGWSVRSEILSPVGDLSLPALPHDQAVLLWTRLLDAWREGQQRPLPLEPAVARAWLTLKADKADKTDKGRTAADAVAAAGDDDGDGDDATDVRAGEDAAAAAARETFGGCAQYSAELRRVWPDFDTLLASGEVEHWARELVLPLLDHLPDAKEAAKDAAKDAAKSPAPPAVQPTEQP